MISAVDTLASQSYGAQNFERVGIVLQRGVVVLSITFIPVFCIWILTEQILLLFGQDPDTSKLAALYVRVQIAGLPAYWGFELVKRYLQTQSIVRPGMVVSAIGLAINTFFSFILIYGFDVGFVGAAIAVLLTYWSMFIALLAIVWVRGLHRKTWGGWSKEAFKGLREFCSLGLPGMAMLCAEWWGFEIHALIAGIQGTTVLAAQTLLLNTLSMVFSVPLGLAISASTRVGNFLGAGEAEKARLSSKVSLYCVAVCSSLMGLFFVSIHDVWGYVFTSEEDVVELVSKVLLVACAFMLTDGLQGVASGVFRGSGRQKLGAAFNLTGYWILALPLGSYLAFGAGWGLMGQWAGLMFGSLTVATLELIVLSRTNWKEQAEKALARENAARAAAATAAAAAAEDSIMAPGPASDEYTGETDLEMGLKQPEHHPTVASEDYEDTLVASSYSTTST